MTAPAPGIVLISDPFLKDPNFMRTAVFMCEHGEGGSLGLVLNRPFDQQLQDFIPELEGLSIPLYYGGPVQPDTLHFLHNIDSLKVDAQPIVEDVFWGGNFEEIYSQIRSGLLDLENIRFFLGYSGWGPGQLEIELAENSWLTVLGSHSLIFDTALADIWKASVLQLDEAFHPLVNYPIDPQLN